MLFQIRKKKMLTFWSLASKAGGLKVLVAAFGSAEEEEDAEEEELQR